MNGSLCHAVHVCASFIKGTCSLGKDCVYLHENTLENGHTKMVMEKFRIKSEIARMLFKKILVAPEAEEADVSPQSATLENINCKFRLPYQSEMFTLRNMCLSFLSEI